MKTLYTAYGVYAVYTGPVYTPYTGPVLNRTLLIHVTQ